MKLVIIESPYQGDVKRNLAYARAALRDSLMRGEAPLASHVTYASSGALDDAVPVERQRGIAAGHAWIQAAEFVAVYDDLGISNGMKDGIEAAKGLGVPIVYRTIGWPRATTQSASPGKTRCGAPSSGSATPADTATPTGATTAAAASATARSSGAGTGDTSDDSRKPQRAGRGL